jgi:hypothetical protein
LNEIDAAEDPWPTLFIESAEINLGSTGSFRYNLKQQHLHSILKHHSIVISSGNWSVFKKNLFQPTDRVGQGLSVVGQSP